MGTSDLELELRELIGRARHEGKWLWCHYQDLWFSPDQLETQNKQGKFVWGAVNWKLRDPQERLDEANARYVQAQAERDRIADEIRR